MNSSTKDRDIKTLRCFLPLDRVYMEYQKYYLFGFRHYLSNTKIEPYPFPEKLQRFLIRTNISRYGIRVNNWLNGLVGGISSEAAAAFEKHNSHVGQYLFHKPDGQTVKFAIDSHDTGEIRSPGIMDWCDIYFKSNFWPSIQYPDKVTPIINGNPLLVSGGDEKRIKWLHRLRNAEKEWDVVFVARLWGGIEHNLRMFEALAVLNCKKYLRAIFAPGILANKEQCRNAERRLAKVGVDFSHKLLPLQELWQLSSMSRLVILRAGKHQCIPWRMLDLLCMGACIICDNNFYPEWPVPLCDGENYISLGIRREEICEPQQLDDYQSATKTIEETLQNEELQSRIRSNNMLYFDNHGSPGRVADYVLSKLQISC